MNPGRPVASNDAPAQDAIGRDEPQKRHPLRWPILVGVALVVMVLVRGLVVQSFYVPSDSMEPALAPGDRILVNKLVASSSLQRGDVVVFDGTRTFADRGRAPAPATGLVSTVLGSLASALAVQTDETDYVKRVVGLPGDHVVCCDAAGRLSINGEAVHESYLHGGDAPSDVTFDVTVPARRIWVMGDHRSDSADSRAHLGDPGGGMVRLDDVIGRVAVVYWPVGRMGVVRAPGELSGVRPQADAGASRGLARTAGQGAR